jgi:hypothetical protein
MDKLNKNYVLRVELKNRIHEYDISFKQFMRNLIEAENETQLEIALLAYVYKQWQIKDRKKTLKC